MRRIAVLLLVVCSVAFGQIAKKVEGLSSMPGYFPLFWDAKNGKMFLEIPRLDAEFLYVTGLPAGLGSNDIGLDRGQLSGGRIVRFERSGNKVLLVQPNYRFRAITTNTDERRSVEEAFAQSVLFGFKVEADDGQRVLVDATEFFLRDVHNVVRALAGARQGTFRMDANRSAFYLPRTKNFPKNTEVEVTLTFTGEQPGNYVQEVAPSADSVTVREHHSFVELPGPGYQPREFDPRSGYFGIEYMDFATAIEEPIRKRYISRHRLNKSDRREIVYYLDRGAPEPIRSALLDGARWWADAFAAAGYPNAFRVELMPEGADPMDARYNVIQWVHRSTRGWSYGNTISDPRTGEIIKGHVTLGSLRVRQDYLIAEGLLAPYETGKPASDEMRNMALARLRQLSAHEVGHTLGLSHNYVASASNRASVMDYPHPVATLEGPGAPSLKNAYATGMGEWDKVSIVYGYGDFSNMTAARKVLEDAYAKGMYFITDSDSRAPGGAHPASHLWDNGANAVDELERVMKVRARALSRFSDANIREGRPLSLLEEVLVPLYLGHRYQTEAASKVLGGLEYTYALRGDKQVVTNVVPAAEQRRALDAVLRTIDAESLVLPERVLAIIPPRAYGYPRNRETFRSRTGVTFDALAPAEAAANITLGFLLHHDRASRLVQYHARDSKLPGLQEVLDKLMLATWKKPHAAGLTGEVQRAVDLAALYHVMALANSEEAAGQARAVAHQKIGELRTWLGAQASASAEQKAHHKFALLQIKRFEENPADVKLPRPVEPPPGQPIGCDWAE
jgi:hypothetical protein